MRMAAKKRGRIFQPKISVVNFVVEWVQRFLALFFLLSITLSSGLFAASSSDVGVKKNLCIYDPVGANGPIFSQMKDYQVAAVDWGVQFELKAYTDERVAAEDFKAGACDMVFITGFKGREFNPFTGTLDSIGSMPSYDHLRTTLQTLSSEKAKSYMKHDGYEVVGMMPAGAAYLFVNDRSIDSVSELSGKRIGILSNDPAQKKLVLNVGASPIGSSVANLYPKFNNGAIDICAGPAVLYEAMELYKGISDDGGIIRFPLAQLTMQLIIRDTDAFSEEFRQSSRDFAMSQFDVAADILQSSEAKIPKNVWIDIPDVEKAEYVEMLRQARISLKNDGVYEGKMLTLMRKIRCKMNPADAECSAADKE